MIRQKKRLLTGLLTVFLTLTTLSTGALARPQVPANPDNTYIGLTWNSGSF